MLLPLVYSTRESGVIAEYRHVDAVRALREFVTDEADTIDPYWREVESLVRGLYQRHAKPGATVFIDKTPRYHLIVDEIADIFPDAQFVFLWRNPLAVVSSVVETFGRGRWNVDQFDVDLRRGIPNLIAAADGFAQRSVELRYEDLVVDPIQEIGRVTDFLGIDVIDDEAILSVRGAAETRGKFGDQSGIREYSGIVTDPLQKWTGTLANPIRRRWAHRYLDSLGDETLARMGYSKADLIAVLDAAPSSRTGLLDDGTRVVRLGGRRMVREALFKRKRGLRPPL